MLISHEYKFIFFHIPKTGGTSITEALKHYCDDQWHTLKGREQLYKTMMCGGTHCIPQQMSMIQKYRDYYKFGFARNPYTRMVSYYEYAKAQLNWVNVNDDFKYFVKLNGCRWKRFLRPVSHYKGLDFIGRYEDLQKDYDKICDKLGIERNELPHHKHMKIDDYWSYYNDHTRQLVKGSFVHDLVKFKYKFGE